MNWLYNYIILGVVLLSSSAVHAQLDLFPIQQDYIEETRAVYSSLDSILHTSTLPFSVRNSALEDSYFFKDTLKYYSVFKAKLLKEDLFSVNENDFSLRVNPLFNFKGGKDLMDTSVYADTTLFIQNSRGFSIDGRIGKRLYFQTGFLENQSFLPRWQKAYADSNLIIPGMGRHKAYKEDGFDYAQSYGWINYYPIDNLNLFFGHGKMFSGHGYRSHNLSHQSFNYPHFKISSTLFKGKVKAMWSMAALQNLTRLPLGEVPESLFKRKAATFSSLSYLLGKRVEISVFESNMWKRYSEFNGTEPLDPKAYVPVPMLGYLTQRIDSIQSSRLGFNLLIKMNNKIQVYGQYQVERKGVQIGARINDVALKGLRILAEYNRSEKDDVVDPLVGFTHFNEGIGHPLLSSFEEWIGVLNYRKNRWSGSCTYAQVSTISKRLTLDLRLSYLVNPRSNFNISTGYLHRENNELINQKSGVVYLGLSTSVFDSFYNF